MRRNLAGKQGMISLYAIGEYFFETRKVGFDLLSYNAC